MDVKTLDKIIRLKQKGLSLREIGILVDMSPEGVRNAIDKYKLKRSKKIIN